MKIAVLGGGNGAYAMAADLSIVGYEVNMYELPQFEKNLAAARAFGGIELIVKTLYEGEECIAPAGGNSGFAEIKGKITTDMKTAVEGVDVINIIVPAYGHRVFFERLIPHLEDGQIVVIHPGNFGSLVFTNMLRESGTAKNVVVAETECLLYATRIVGPSIAHIRQWKRKVLLSALPAVDAEKALEVINQYHPQFAPAANIFETSINNPNSVLHTASAICNASQIEKLGAYKYDHYDATPSVGRVMAEVDREKQLVSKALGMQPTPLKNILIRYYGKGSPEDTLYEVVCKTYPNGNAPSDLKHRYITEDVPYGLVPISSIGDELNVATPTMKALTQLASIFNETDYRKEGLTAEMLGLKGLSAEEIVKHVTA